MEREHRHRYSGCGSREVKRDGLRGEDLQSGLSWAAALTPVKSYIAETGASAAAFHHLAALVAHSVDVMESPVSATPSAASTCIGVGDLVKKIDNIKEHVAVYDARQCTEPRFFRIRQKANHNCIEYGKQQR